MSLSWNDFIKENWTEVKNNTKGELPKFNSWIKTQKEPYKQQKKKNSNVKVVKAVTEKVKNPKAKIKVKQNERRELTYTPAVAKHIFKSFSDALDIPEMFNARVVNSIEYKKYLESKNFFNVGYNKKFAEVCYQYANTYSRDIISDDPLFHLPLYLNNKMLRMGDIRKIVSREDSKVLVDFTISYFGGRNVYFKDPPGVNFDFAVLVNNLNPIKSIIKIGMTLTNTANRSGMLVKTNRNIGNNITEFWKNASVDDLDPIYQDMDIDQFDFNSLMNLLQGQGEIRIRQPNVKKMDELEDSAGEYIIRLTRDADRGFVKGEYVYHRQGWYALVEHVGNRSISVVNPSKGTLTRYASTNNFIPCIPDVDGEVGIPVKEVGSTKSNIELQKHYLKSVGVEGDNVVDINNEVVKDTREDLSDLITHFNLNAIRNIGDGVYYLQFNH